MSNFSHNSKKYFSCHTKEIVSMVVTSFFASFILSFNKWGESSFDMSAGLQAWGLTFIFFLFFLAVTVLISKTVAIRLGYVINYHSHLVGLFVGLVICLASNGYLPLFLPGGFAYDRPSKLAIGKFIGRYKGWEIGVIAGAFPGIMLLFVLILSPLYLATQSEFYLTLITAVCLTAIFACIPLPNFNSSNRGGNKMEWYKYLRGCTFGLDVLYASGPWYVILSLTVLFFSLLTWLLTVVGVRVGIIFYILSLALAVVGWMVYLKFFDN